MENNAQKNLESPTHRARRAEVVGIIDTGNATSESNKKEPCPHRAEQGSLHL